MTDHEHDALDALRRLDGPVELADGVEARIEAELLARFDARSGRSSPPVEGSTVIALEQPRERAERRRSHRLVMAVATAAAVAAVVAGLVAIVAGDESEPANPTVTSPPETTASTTVARSDETSLTDQLASFCAAYVAPTRDTDALWRPDGTNSEPRANVLIAVERAAQAMSELEPPLGDRLADTANQLLDLVADARLAHTLDEARADDAVSRSRDLLFAAPSTSGVATPPESCSP